MIRSADSDLAANRYCSFGTTGEVRLFRGFTSSGALTWPVIPLSEATDISQTVPARTFHDHMHSGCSHFPRGKTIQNP
jgi:hypothetical protein